MEKYSSELKPSPRRRKKEKKFTFSYFVIIWLIALLVLNFILLKYKRKNDFKEKRQEIITLQNEINELEGKKKKLEQEIYYLNTDRGIEDMARKKLGLVKKDEIAIVVLDEKNRKVNYEDSYKEENTQSSSIDNKPEGIIDKILKFLHIRREPTPSK
ncbi:MAG: septum formation initiator family protein [Armatimonadota bacterium]